MTDTTRTSDELAGTIDLRSTTIPRATLVGRRAVATLADGTTRVGTLEQPGRFGGAAMVVRFDDGTWMPSGFVLSLSLTDPDDVVLYDENGVAL